MYQAIGINWLRALPREQPVSGHQLFLTGWQAHQITLHLRRIKSPRTDPPQHPNFHLQNAIPFLVPARLFALDLNG